MRPLIRTLALSTMLVACVAGFTFAQEEEGRRRARPRERAPQTQAAPAPQAPRPHDDRAAQRSRGTDDQGRVRAPRDNGNRERGEGRERIVQRAPEPAPVTRSEPVRQAEPTRAPDPASAAPVTSSQRSDDDQDRRRRAVPRGSRPRGDNPAVGRAEPRDGWYPRDGRVSPRDGRGYPRSRVYTSRGRVYNNYYYYYPRRWYPYGYGAFGGLGYFYYDPYTWYSYDPYWSRPHYYNYYSSHRGYGDYYYATGELRLLVHPRHAEVYVDGYFAGHVDDFDGIFQALRLEEGPYKVEIVAPGYEPLVFDVRIIPGRKITYRGELRPGP
jgi:hypothetical protein